MTEETVRAPDERSTSAARSRERYRRASLTALATVGSRGIGALATLITVPLTLNYLGTERYGLWMTISSLIAFLIFTDLGIGNGLLTAIAGASGRQDRLGASRYSASAFWMLVAVAAGIVVLLAATYPFVNWAAVFNVRGAQATAEAGPAMITFGVCFAASLPLAAVTQIRYGNQEGYLNSAFVAAGSILGLASVLVVIELRLGLPYLVLALLGAPIVAGVANAAVLFVRQRPWLAPRPGNFHLRTAVALLRSGSQFFVLQIAVAAAFYSDSLIAARVIGPEAVAEYAVATKLFLIPAVLATAAVGPLWPAYSEALASGDVAWLKATLRRSLAMVLAITVPISAGLALLSGGILELWVGDAVSPPMLLIVGIAVWTVMSAVGTAMAMLFNGLHILGVQVATAIVMAVLNVGISIALASRIGVAGVILGTVIAYPISTLLPLSLYLPRVFRRLEQTPSGRDGRNRTSP